MCCDSLMREESFGSRAPVRAIASISDASASVCERNGLRRAMRVPCAASEILNGGSLDDRRACVWGSLDDRQGFCGNTTTEIYD